MKRLTFEGNFCDIAQCQNVSGGSFCEDGCCSQKKIWERLKKYEDAEAEGRLFITPVAVGQTLWFLCMDLPQFCPDTNGWYISPAGVMEVSNRHFCTGDPKLDDCIPFCEIGEWVFLSREEAEAALERKVSGEKERT